jgi:Ca2+-binding EF-hand superfamily protein
MCPVCAQQEKIVQRLYQKRGNNQQNMTAPELREFMEEYVRELEGSEHRVVTDEEVLYVLKVADTLGTGEIRVAEIVKAVATWQTLLLDQELIDSRFELYDHDSTGTLSKPQVAELLKDLNGGVAVGQDEVDWVVGQADGKAEGELDGRVDHGELRVVLAVWYSMNNDKLKSRTCNCCCGRGPVDDETRGSAQPVRPNFHNYAAVS